MKQVNVMSLFNGMSCGNIALDRIGANVGKYYSSEVDAHAIKVTQANYPNTIQLGDVTKWREWDLDWSSIDLFIGGSPCQGFSSAGKQGGTKAIVNGETVVISTREQYENAKQNNAEFLSCSHLFWEFVLCLDHVKSCNPNVKFMLENVKMSKPNMALITEALGVEPVFINSALVSAQNRQRYYWANWEITQPEDKSIDMMSVIELNPEQKTEISERQLHRIDFNGLNNCCLGVCFDIPAVRLTKSLPLLARDYKGIPKKQYFNAVHINGEYRKLTVVEYCRLQTVPDDYFNGVASNTQAYKMLGNGWTVDVIAHIFRCMFK